MEFWARFTIFTIGALFLQSLATIIYNVFLSPLRKIPGPWYASITALPARIACGAQKRQVHYCHDLHKRYGPFVRMTPNEVLVSDPAAFKEIYRIGTPFRKSRLYNFLNPTPPGEPPFGLFQETDVARHQAQRKSNWEGVVHERVDAVLGYMKSEAALNGGEVDLYKWWPLMSGDVISTLMFGESFKMIERGRPDEIMADIQRNGEGNIFAYTFPLVYQVIRWLPISGLQNYFQGSPVAIERGKLAIQNSRGGGSHHKNIFSKVLAEAEKGNTLTDREITVQAGVMMFAGTDTTATTLMYLVWSVLSDAEAQRHLEEELSQLDLPFSDEKLEKLPILNAVLRETLRMYGAASNTMPRVAPPGGVTLGGYFIPGGTEVATQPWTLHRKADVFENPDRFDHRRWLGDLASRPEVKASWAPFGAGSRICIGMHLADMEVRLAAASFFRECRGARLAASTTPESMEVENIALIAPRGHACRVVLR